MMKRNLKLGKRLKEDMATACTLRYCDPHNSTHSVKQAVMYQQLEGKLPLKTKENKCLGRGTCVGPLNLYYPT